MIANPINQRGLCMWHRGMQDLNSTRKLIPYHTVLIITLYLCPHYILVYFQMLGSALIGRRTKVGIYDGKVQRPHRERERDRKLPKYVATSLPSSLSLSLSTSHIYWCASSTPRLFSTTSTARRKCILHTFLNCYEPEN